MAAAVAIVDVLRLDRCSGDLRAQVLTDYGTMEGALWYPLGEDRFRIDHGRDPMEFFERLGRPIPLAARIDDGLVGFAVVVEREVRRHGGGRPEIVHYVCDFKTAPGAPPHVALSLMRAVDRVVPRDGRAYGVFMDRADGPDRLVSLLARWRARFGIEGGPRLRIHGVDPVLWQECAERLSAQRGPVVLRDLAGLKDLVIESSGQRIDLLHAQWGVAADGGGTSARPGGVHMFATQADDPGWGDVPVLGTASVLHRGMGGWDWSFVLTSDI